jgi:hypothetical protein
LNDSNQPSPSHIPVDTKFTDGTDSFRASVKAISSRFDNSDSFSLSTLFGDSKLRNPSVAHMDTNIIATASWNGLSITTQHSLEFYPSTLLSDSNQAVPSDLPIPAQLFEISDSFHFSMNLIRSIFRNSDPFSLSTLLRDSKLLNPSFGAVPTDAIVMSVILLPSYKA